jgi:GH35 family endo-1,4-beta-xylanase
MAAVMANIQHVDRVSLWGLSDRHSWLDNWPWKRVNHGLLFDRNSTPKPAFHAVPNMLKNGSLAPDPEHFDFFTTQNLKI